MKAIAARDEAALAQLYDRYRVILFGLLMRILGNRQEAEDVLQDAARHATVFARGLWLKHRKVAPGPSRTTLQDVTQRLNILLKAVFGRTFGLKVAEPPLPATFP